MGLYSLRTTFSRSGGKVLQHLVQKFYCSKTMSKTLPLLNSGRVAVKILSTLLRVGLTRLDRLEFLIILSPLILGLCAAAQFRIDNNIFL